MHLGIKTNGRNGHPVRPATSAELPVCLLPGPVALSERVQAAFREPLLYHRGEEFQPLFQRVRERLSSLIGGKKTAMFVGSGTLANDAIAATLAAEGKSGNGLVLVSGEFGERLLKQARRWKLEPRLLAWNWGKPWDFEAVEAAMRDLPEDGWVWGAHHETSTGVLNDVPGLVALAKKHGKRVCVDCVSSIGTVPVDLSGVYLASGTSGKAIGSYAGLAFVFGDPADLSHLDAEMIPDYLNVPAALSAIGPRFTVPSPLVAALDAALEPLGTTKSREARFAQIAALGQHLRERLKSLGCTPLAADADANPAIITFAPPGGQSAADFVVRCREWGYLIAGQSGYLADRNLVQIAVMGAVSREDVDGLLDLLAND